MRQETAATDVQQEQIEEAIKRHNEWFMQRIAEGPLDEAYQHILSIVRQHLGTVTLCVKALQSPKASAEDAETLLDSMAQSASNTAILLMESQDLFQTRLASRQTTTNRFTE